MRPVSGSLCLLGDYINVNSKVNLGDVEPTLYLEHAASSPDLTPSAIPTDCSATEQSAPSIGPAGSGGPGHTISARIRWQDAPSLPISPV